MISGQVAQIESPGSTSHEETRLESQLQTPFAGCTLRRHPRCCPHFPTNLHHHHKKKPPGDYQRLLLSSRASSPWSNLELFLRCVPFIAYIIVVLALSLSLSLGCVFLIIYRVSKKVTIKFFDLGPFLVFWTPLDNFGHITQIWTFLATLDPFGPFWTLLNAFGRFWTFLDALISSGLWFV